jgi:hypothetical protein
VLPVPAMVIFKMLGLVNSKLILALALQQPYFSSLVQRVSS